MKQPLKFILSIGLVMLSTRTAFADTQTLIISEGSRLEASIAADVMNRLAVANDRIVNVFGDDGTFVTQTDDQTGQVFIKPTAENGVNPLSITVITENNVTQDLTLNPTPGPASTIILKNTVIQSEKLFSEDLPLPQRGSEAEASTQERVIQVMKKAALGELDLSQKKRMRRKAPKGFKLSFDKAYQSGSYLVTLWQIKDNSCSQNELVEKSFYQTGDLALSIRSQSKKIFLYVLRRT